MVACLPQTRGSKLCLQMPSTTSAEVPWKRWRSLSSRSISDIRRDMYSFFLLEQKGANEEISSRERVTHLLYFSQRKGFCTRWILRILNLVSDTVLWKRLYTVR
ncbi:hypothetical protein EYF80_017199 [Liparis tanakae]|uniref:Uncharacterized protein n=1 Tax=Liparis tanakae TaxID=230148 RepID=A0A4Z2I5P3_9TELE|nr:hypothetical protein EYF80_017199 [Liparis tanakae]